MADVLAAGEEIAAAHIPDWSERREQGSRRRKLAVSAVGALAVAGAAVAAFLVFTGADGSGNGTFEAATLSPALTISGTSQPELSPGVNANMNVSVTSNDANASHDLVDLAGTAFSSSPPECASHLAVGGASGILGTYTPGQTKTGTINIGADASLPGSCAAGTWSVTFGGTTTP
jgi:hypothetical protein